MKRKLLLLMLMLGLVMTGCASKENAPVSENNADNEPIKIGVVTPLTGPVSIYGKANQSGIEMAAEEINANGGINGREVQLIVMDDKGEITDAVTSFNKLMESNVDAVIGAFTSKPSLALAETAKNYEVPVITPGGTQEEITMGKPNVFRQTFTNNYQGSLLAIHAKDNLNATTAAILKNGSDDYSTGIAKSFAEKCEELGIEIVADETYGLNDTDFKAQLTGIGAKNPDVILLPDYYEKLSLIIPQAREVGIKSVFIGPDGWSGVLSAISESNYDAIEGSYFNDHFAPDSDEPIVMDFVKNYTEKYGEEPISPAALGYDSMYLIAQAIEEAGSTENKAVVDAIKNIEFNGVTGSVKFDENNNPIKSSSIIELTDGKYKFNTIVEPR